MFNLSRRRVVLGLASLYGLSPLLARADKPATDAPKVETFTGKVVPLADVVAKTGSKLDPDATALSLVLVADDGKVYPVVKDTGGRLFFKDADLLNRPMQLTGKLLPNSQILQVTLARSLVKGEPHEIYYWCDICSIRRGEKMTCECCGGPMERHEEPVKK